MSDSMKPESDRLTYRISDINRRRLEILKAFAILNRSAPTMQDIVNQSIQDYFVSAYERYCSQSSQSDFLRRAMEEMLPEMTRFGLSESARNS